MEQNKLDSFEYVRNKGLFVNGKKYGLCIIKLEIDEGNIKVYINKNTALKFDEMAKFNHMEDFCNPYELKKYKNVIIIEE